MSSGAGWGLECVCAGELDGEGSPALSPPGVSGGSAPVAGAGEPAGRCAPVGPLGSDEFVAEWPFPLALESTPSAPVDNEASASLSFPDFLGFFADDVLLPMVGRALDVCAGETPGWGECDRDLCRRLVSAERSDGARVASVSTTVCG